MIGVFMTEKKEESIVEKAGHLMASAGAAIAPVVGPVATSEARQDIVDGLVKANNAYVGFWANLYEKIGFGCLNDLQVRGCNLTKDVPVLGQLNAPACRVLSDAVAERGHKK
jgi:hypothetical protein